MKKLLIFAVLIICCSNSLVLSKKLKKGAHQQSSTTNQQQVTYPYVLPPLDYDYADLEPYIDTMTMKIHHTKHHQAYVDNLNKALQPYPGLHKKSLEELLASLNTLPKNVRTAIRNHGGGHYNHSLLWPLMAKKGGGKPKGLTAQAIANNFGSFETFKNEFNRAAKSVFGSGWVWVVLDK